MTLLDMYGMVFAMVLWFSEYEPVTNIHFTFTFSDPDLLVVRIFGCAHFQIYQN